MIIREIQKEDNEQVAAVIRQVLIELNVPKVGTAYADPQLDSMFEAYENVKSVYYVIENKRKIMGGAGIMQLENSDSTICELQKMYFLPEARGLGLGTQLMEKCLWSATTFGFEKCYLETMPYMIAAQTLYKKVGFEYICAPMGNTGHTSCPVWMLKDL
jgi:putative acetyltransferase